MIERERDEETHTEREREREREREFSTPYRYCATTNNECANFMSEESCTKITTHRLSAHPVRLEIPVHEHSVRNRPVLVRVAPPRAEQPSVVSARLVVASKHAKETGI
jgi:hypothetical protein